MKNWRNSMPSSLAKTRVSKIASLVVELLPSFRNAPTHRARRQCRHSPRPGHCMKYQKRLHESSRSINRNRSKLHQPGGSSGVSNRPKDQTCRVGLLQSQNRSTCRPGPVVVLVAGATNVRRPSLACGSIRSSNTAPCVSLGVSCVRRRCGVCRKSGVLVSLVPYLPFPPIQISMVVLAEL